MSEQLWVNYEKDRSEQNRNAIIEKYAGLIRVVAGRLYSFYERNIEREDLEGYGAVGLIDAIEKFDRSKGVKFESYASLRIRGSIMDAIREVDWVPRSVRKKSRDLYRAISELELKLCREPSNVEIAEFMGIDLKQVDGLFSETANFNIDSLEGMFADESGESTFVLPDNEEPVEDSYEKEEIKNILRDFIETMKPQEKTVISLYYYEELTLKEIALIMKVSESRISQIHSKAILRMRTKLAHKIA